MLLNEQESIPWLFWLKCSTFEIVSAIDLINSIIRISWEKKMKMNQFLPQIKSWITSFLVSKLIFRYMCFECISMNWNSTTEMKNVTRKQNCNNHIPSYSFEPPTNRIAPSSFRNFFLYFLAGLVFICFTSSNVEWCDSAHVEHWR